MNYRLIGLVIVAAFMPGWPSSCLGRGSQKAAPTSGVYVYGPPTSGESTTVQFYPKNWRGPRYAYPQAYYFKYPPFRRPVSTYVDRFVAPTTPGRGVNVTQLTGRAYIDQTFFTGATTNAEIWAIRRKGEVPDLPASARVNYPAQTRLAPVIGPLPNRPMSRSSFERMRTAVERRP